MSEFRMTDTTKADGFYITFERITEHDPDADPREYLFQDPDYKTEDQARLDAWQNDEWHFIGIQAKATCLIVRNGTGVYYTLTSPGLWAIESDSDESYLESVYEEEIATLKADIAAMSDPIYTS